MHDDTRAAPRWFPQVFEDLRRHEGFREFAYPDPLSRLAREFPFSRHDWGKRPAVEIMAELGISHRAAEGAPWTVGYGFTEGVSPVTFVNRTYADRKLERIIHEYAADLDTLLPEWRRAYPQYVQEVLVNLVFNLGVARLRKFGTTLGLIREGKYASAGVNLRKTLWYKQVKSRAVELTNRLINGYVAPEHKVRPTTPDFTNVISKVNTIPD